MKVDYPYASFSNRFFSPVVYFSKGIFYEVEIICEGETLTKASMLFELKLTDTYL